MNNDSSTFFKRDMIEIYNDDILLTRKVAPRSIDLIVTSPPYSIDIKYGNYDDGISYPEYLEFTKKWLKQCLVFARSDGRMCLNIPLDKNKGGQQSVYADVLSIAKSVGWKYHTTIIWNEQNISRRTAWGSWLSASAPFIISPVEVIVVLYKNFWKKQGGGSRESDITREEFIEWTNGMWIPRSSDHQPLQNQEQHSNIIWRFNGESKRKVGHPSPFPVELPTRCIKLFSFVGDIVLDPFMGSGSTLVACKENRRTGIGIEIDRNYCKIARERLMGSSKTNYARSKKQTSTSF